jgi:putative transposase
MPNYRRAFQPGGKFFFTLVTERRAPIFEDEWVRAILRRAIAEVRTNRPFTLEAIVLLPEHSHLMLGLPDGDADFSTRIAATKAIFTREYLRAGGVEHLQSSSRESHHHRGVWQRRFWEHAISDESDYENHLHYLHYNPVKHGLASCPHAWPHSTFQQLVQHQIYEPDWLCTCEGRRPTIPNFDHLAGIEMD